VILNVLQLFLQIATFPFYRINHFFLFLVPCFGRLRGLWQKRGDVRIQLIQLLQGACFPFF
jgi:hypothetical protein